MRDCVCVRVGVDIPVCVGLGGVHFSLAIIIITLAAMTPRIFQCGSTRAWKNETFLIYENDNFHCHYKGTCSATGLGGRAITLPSSLSCYHYIYLTLYLPAFMAAWVPWLF